MTVKTFAQDKSLWPQIVATVESMVPKSAAATFLQHIANIPVRKSRATRVLGSYVSKQGEPVCIRLQFAQEESVLKNTFLHEVAHVCDHLLNQPGKKYRRAHSANWKLWAKKLGISPSARGSSINLTKLYAERTKHVATCQKCHEKFYRLRKFNSGAEYRHRSCGGRLLLI